MYHEIPIKRVRPSPLNPRHRVNAIADQELAESVRQAGIIEPIIVRTVEGGYEIVAGERRFRAAMTVDLREVPCLVRELTDSQVLELMLIENDQRQDLHPLDEAEGYRRLMVADPRYTPETIAAKIGKSKSYVTQRLKLDALVPKAREAFEADRLTAGHAILIARLTPANQKRALDVCFDVFRYGDEGSEPEHCISVRELNRWIDDEFRLDLTSTETPEIFPELAAEIAAAQEEGRTLVELTRDYSRPAKDLKKGALPSPLSQQHWKAIEKKKDRCDHAQRGVIVQGDGRAQVLEVCATKGCPKHFPPPAKAEAAAAMRQKTQRDQQETWQQRQARQEAQRHRWDALRQRILPVLVEKTKGLTLTTRVVEMAVKHVLDPYEIKTALKLVKPSVATFPQLVVLAAAQTCAHDQRHFEKVAKAFGVDTAKIGREFGAAEKIAQKATTKTHAQTSAKRKPLGRKPAKEPAA